MFEQLLEDASTIRKAMRSVHALQTGADSNDAHALNQATRWIMTKEKHADHIIAVMGEYFLAQRVYVIASPDCCGYCCVLSTVDDLVLQIQT